MELEKPKRRTILSALGAGVAGGTVLAGSSAARGPPKRMTKSINVAAGTPFDAVDKDGNRAPFDDPSTKLWLPMESKTGVPGDSDPWEKLIAPGGHHVMWREWSEVSGSVTLNCLEEGTHVTVHADGLLDKGLYTIWVIVPGKGGGPLGPNDGGESFFRASASGQGHIVEIHEPKEIPLGPPGKQMYKKCLLEEEMVLIIGDYHNDDQTHGTVPTPHALDHFVAVF